MKKYCVVERRISKKVVTNGEKSRSEEMKIHGPFGYKKAERIFNEIKLNRSSFVKKARVFAPKGSDRSFECCDLHHCYSYMTFDNHDTYDTLELDLYLMEK